MDLVDLITRQLSSGWIEKLAGMLGISTNAARTATDAAVPTLLAGLTQVASTPDGARRLDAAVEAADDSAVANPARGLSKSVAESGNQALQSLFGGSALSGVSGALAKFTNLGSGTINSLLGVAAPMVLGMLKGQKQSLGLDAGGLANLLSSQKQNIMGAMPSGLTSMLSGVPGLSSLGDWARGAASAGGAAFDRGREAVGDAAGRAGAAASEFGSRSRQAASDVAVGARNAFADTHARSSGAGSALKWLVPLALILGAGWLVWRMVGNREVDTSVADRAAATGRDAVDRTAAAGRDAVDRTAEAGRDVADRAVSAGQRAVAEGGQAVDRTAVAGRDAADRATSDATDAAQTAGAAIADGGASLNTRMTGLITSATDTFKKIRDPASAEATLPELQALSTKLDSAKTLVDKLPAGARTQLATQLGESRSALNTSIDKVMAIPGVSEKIKPTVDDVRRKLVTILGEPADAGGAGTAARNPQAPPR